MKVIITEAGIEVQDAPALDPRLGDGDGGEVATFLQQFLALQWAMERISKAGEVAMQRYEDFKAFESQTEQLLQRMREGLH